MTDDTCSKFLENFKKVGFFRLISALSLSFLRGLLRGRLDASIADVLVLPSYNMRRLLPSPVA